MNRFLLWRFVPLLMAASAVLAGCQDHPRETTAVFNKPQYHWGEISGQTITIRGSQADLTRPYMLKAFERYHTLTGNSVHLEGLSHQELAQNLPAAFVAHSVERPDILLSFGGTNLDNLDPDVNFYDFTNAPWVNDLTDTAINQTIYNGRVIGLPYGEASISGTLYNKELFKKCGVTVPRTQKEFFAACEILLRHGVTPLYLPYAERTMMLYQFPLDSIAQDAKILDGLNSGTLSYAQIPDMKKIVEWYKTMSERGYFGRDYTRNDWAGMNNAMLNEKYAMMLCWDTWLYTDFTGDPSRFGIMPAFMGVPEQGLFEGPNLAMLIVNKNSPQLDAALDLISFIADPYNYNVALAGMYTAPAFKNQVGSASTPQYGEAERLIEKLFIDSTAWQRIRGFSQLDAEYIQTHMRNDAYSVEDCLNSMDAARLKRAGMGGRTPKLTGTKK